MPPSCKRCASTHMLNLNTAQRISVVGSTLVGGAIGAWRATTQEWFSGKYGSAVQVPQSDFDKLRASLSKRAVK